ncbi:MAG TPA: imidazole glycerol phosphate synthase subunit HisH [Bacteroidota bacterium]|nr:imidazole glycerol phosphate synthase subunit HisH [Bacteroidota bacterium]
MIGIVDYEMGGIASVSNALSQIGADFTVGRTRTELSKCDGIILPGIGAAPGAMTSLHDQGLTTFLSSLKTPFLGVCLGMQLLHTFSEEGDTTCLKVLPGTVKRMNHAVCKVPHIGWNEVQVLSNHPLFEGLKNPAYFYFSHSYAAPVGPATTAVSDCGVRFASAVSKDRYFGVQFHPEKSGDAGLQFLKNFAKLCKSLPR